MQLTSRHLRTAFAALLVLLPLAVFGQILGHQFLSFDDDLNVTANEVVLSGDIATFWEAPHKGLYIPVPYTLWTLLAEVSASDQRHGGLDPRPFLLTNLVLHICVSLLVFALLYLITTHATASGLGALFFCLHPVQVESVAWVSELKGLCCAFFLLLAFVLYVRGALLGQERSPKGAAGSQLVGMPLDHYVGALFALGLALLSKPVAVAAPVALFLLDAFVLRRQLRRVLVWLLPWIFLALPVALVTATAQATDAAAPSTPLLWRPVVLGDTLAFYLGKILLPLNLGIDYGRVPAKVVGSSASLMLCLVPLGLAALIAVFRKRIGFLAPPLLAALVLLLPVSGLVPFFFQIISTVADRYLYLPLVFVALALALALARYARREDGRVVLAGLAVVLVLATLSFFQTRTWAANKALYTHALAMNPDSGSALINLGKAYNESGQPELAEPLYKHLLELQPEHHLGWNNYGNSLTMQGKHEEAIKAFEQALALMPGYVPALTGKASALIALGENGEAALALRQALARDPGHINARLALARCLARLGRLETAEDELETLLRLAPRNVQARQLLAAVKTAKARTAN